MDIKFYYPRWGSEQLPWSVFLKKIQLAGFDGVEVYPLQTIGERPEMLSLLADHGLEFSLLHVEMIEGKDVNRYLDALERNLYQLVAYQTNDIKPQFITTQTGREYYSSADMEKCFDICNRISRESGIPIIQETHRNKWSYAAHIVKDYLERYPELTLALDISHWFCVSESYLEDQQQSIDLAIKHTKHLHARVGHIEGPQITDPRAEENQVALQHHLRNWDKWIAHMRNSNSSRCTITPEFGPYPYLNYKIGTNTPIVSQWEINCYMKDILKERYQLNRI